jgi:hypothetical protein
MASDASPEVSLAFMAYFLAYRIAQNGVTDNASFVYKLTTNFWGVQRPVVSPKRNWLGRSADLQRWMLSDLAEKTLPCIILAEGLKADRRKE